MISDINSNYVYRPVDSIVYGKEDYALLYITGAVSNEATLPPTFPYLDIYKGPALPINTPVILSGYSSENFSGASIQRDLYQLSSPTIVSDQKPIGTSSVAQIISFTGNISSQHGASGGAVISHEGKVAGIMTYLNKGYGKSTQDRILHAITTDYILSDFASQKQMTMEQYLSAAPLIDQAKKFNDEFVSKYQQMHVKMWKERGFNIPGVN